MKIPFRAVAAALAPVLLVPLLGAPAQADDGAEIDAYGRPRLVMAPSTASFGADLATAASWCDFSRVSDPTPYLIEHRAGTTSGEVSSATMHLVLIGVRGSDLVCVVTTAEYTGTVREFGARAHSAVWSSDDRGFSITGFEAIAGSAVPDGLEPGFIAQSAGTTPVAPGEWITWKGETDLNESYRAPKPVWDEDEARAAHAAETAEADAAYDQAVAPDLMIRTDAEALVEKTYDEGSAAAHAVYERAVAPIRDNEMPQDQALAAKYRAEVASLREKTTATYQRAVAVEERARVGALAREQAATKKAKRVRAKALVKAGRKKSAASRAKARAKARATHTRTVAKARAARKATIAAAARVRAEAGRSTDQQFTDGAMVLFVAHMRERDALQPQRQAGLNRAAEELNAALAPLQKERRVGLQEAERVFSAASAAPRRMRDDARLAANSRLSQRLGGYEYVAGARRTHWLSEKFTF